MAIRCSQYFWALLGVALFLSVPSIVFARGPQEIGYTLHNLSISGFNAKKMLPSEYAANNEDRICVFCHTPHGGSLDAPLWNRDISNQNGHGAGIGYYQHYTSATLSSAGANTTRDINPESLICLSCHDGSIGVGGNLINTGGITPSNSTKNIAGINGIPGPRIGGSLAAPTASNDLRDDHPISISMQTAFNAKGLAEFKDPATVTADLRMFGGTNYMVECATCHDPHVNYTSLGGGDPSYAPFLAMPNTNSGMCLACHVK